MNSLQRNELLNAQIRDRNLPSSDLQPLLSFYPKSTKYMILPVVDTKSPTLLKSYDIFNTTQVFNPGNTKSPWNGYANAINIESALKNQMYPLGRKEENVYIPNSTSDLYSYPSFSFGSPLRSAGLNEPPLFNASNKGNIFNNCTRHQMKEAYLK